MHRLTAKRTHKSATQQAMKAVMQLVPKMLLYLVKKLKAKDGLLKADNNKRAWLTKNKTQIQ